MNSNVVARSTPKVVEAPNPEYTWLEKYSLLSSHPRALAVSLTGLVWFSYYFWNNNWPLAAVYLIGLKSLALWSVFDCNEERLSKTLLGKIALLRLRPLNFTLTVLGAIVSAIGIWQHSILVLCGASLLLLGNISGWSALDSRYTSLDRQLK